MKIELTIQDINPVWKKFREMKVPDNQKQDHADYCHMIDQSVQSLFFVQALEQIIDGIKHLNFQR